MEDRLLTYYRICQLLRDGLQKAIPSGYNIVYGIEPQKVFKVEVDEKSIEIKNDKFPKPKKAFISGEYVVHVPPPDFDGDEEKLLEFGDVFVQTDFFLDEIIFLYEEPNEIRKYMEGMYSGCLMKKDCVVSAKISNGSELLEIYNMLVKRAWQTTVEEKDEPTKTDTSVEFDYDYFKYEKICNLTV